VLKAKWPYEPWDHFRFSMKSEIWQENQSQMCLCCVNPTFSVVSASHWFLHVWRIYTGACFVSIWILGQQLPASTQLHPIASCHAAP
jgi:hypothetical protein